TQTGIWETGIDDHMREVSAMLATYGAIYRGKLTARECVVFYDRFDDDKRRSAFRICRGLASCARAIASGAFFLSCRELATRINCHPDTANVILRELKAERLVECVTAGDSLRVQLPPGEIR